MSKKNLLICFDAFGTLFKPRRPVAAQYAEVATSLGLRGITEGAVQSSFKAAFKNESKQNPNYGKANGMDAEKWWTNIIRNTFQPLLQKDEQLPSELVPQLLHRFWSNEGYMLCKDVPLVLRGARNLQSLRYDRVVVGVITNSDDRVPDILTSLGLKVSPLRYSPPRSESLEERGHWDVDFAVMSYDIGHEKPDRRIFAAAEEMLDVIPGQSHGDADAVDRAAWDKVYVGDEYDKDVRGAVDAGWNAILVDGEATDDVKAKVDWRDDGKPGSLGELFRSSAAVGFSSMTKLAEWLR